MNLFFMFLCSYRAAVDPCYKQCQIKWSSVLNQHVYSSLVNNATCEIILGDTDISLEEKWEAKNNNEGCLLLEM